MIRRYGIKNKSGKQCRERWINFLCPNINKGMWSEKEEKILFSTQLKIGNKWSELAKLLPGRSENDIKNHFYSKLRKYIRKICKELQKSKILEKKGINSSYYSSQKVYSLIQKENLSLVNLSKNSIINIIQKDYLNKQERLLSLQDKSLSNFKLDNYQNANSYFLYNNMRNNQISKKYYIDSDFIKNNKNYDNDSQNNNNQFFKFENLNKKRKGINVFEEI